MGVAEDNVRVEKVSRVAPSERCGKRVVFLSSCDLVCRSYPYINRIFFFRCKMGTPESVAAAAQVMKEGLAKALVAFYPLSGRLCTDEDGRLQVVCEDDGAGAEFVEAVCELPFSSLAQDGFQYRQVFWKLARRTHYLRCDYLHEPVLSVQVTKYKDGNGYSVGVSVSHAVADAQAFYDFVYSWGEVCRGLAMTMPPLHMRDALSVGVLFPVEKHLSSEHVSTMVVNGCDRAEEAKLLVASKEPQNGRTVITELVKQLEHTDLTDKVPPVRWPILQNGQRVSRVRAPIMEKQMEEEEHRKPRTDLVQKVFSFTPEKLQLLKRQVNRGMIAGTESEMFAKLHNECEHIKFAQLDAHHDFTTFEAFCSHWWQCLIRARQLPASQNVFLLIPINCRQRFLNLPRSYFGNALDGALVKLTAGELVVADLTTIASKIHEAIMAVTENSFRQYIKAVECNRNAISHFDRTGLFHIVDSPKYPIYEVDFGYGVPQAVRAEGFRFGAEVQILAGRHGPGSYDLFCALDEDVMQRLEQDDMFLSC